MRRRGVMGIVVAGAVAATVGVVASGTGATSEPAAAATATAARPNVVFVLTDDLSWNLVRHMPHVQQLRRRGLTFSRYVVTDSLCCPSRSSIFTGRFPHDTGVFTNGGQDGGYQVFHDKGWESHTFGTALQPLGYRTAMMGKYLNGYLPRTRLIPPGWTTWDGAGNAYGEFNYNLNEDGALVHYGSTPADYLTDVVAAKGAAFIDAAATAKQPFALEIATFAPHAPATPAPRHASLFAGAHVPRGGAFDRDNVHPPKWLGHRPPLTAAQTASLDALYRKRLQSIQAVDDLIGRLEDTLRARGLLESTYIVFSSDNGFHLGEHRLLQGKMTAFDTDIRVPLVVAGPGVPRGRTSTRLAENIDLHPTFVDLAGGRPEAGVDGRSLVPLIEGRKVARWRTAALVEHHGPDTNGADPDMPVPGSGNPTSYEAIRLANAVYVEYRGGDREYYRIDRDPNERVNVYGKLSRRTRARLHARVAALESCHGGASCWKAGNPR